MDVVDPPERRDEVRVQRVEARRVVPLGGDARWRRCAREIVRVLELVGEEPGRDVAPGLPPVEHGRARRRRSTSGIGAVEAVEHQEWFTVPRTTTGSRSVSRRTKRQSIAGRRAGADDGVEPVGGRVRDRDEHGVGVRRPRGSARCRASRRGPVMPSRRRRIRRGSSSTNPTTRSPGVSRSSRSRLRPDRPAPTISVRRPSRSRQSPSRGTARARRSARCRSRPCRGARRGRRCSPGSSPSGVVRTTIPNATASETADPDDDRRRLA